MESAVIAAEEQGDLRRVPFGSEIHARIVDFVDEEVAVLNSDRFVDWLKHLADDIEYTFPQRAVLRRRAGHGYDHGTGYVFDDLKMLTLRARRGEQILNAYDRDPPPRIRRFVTNIVVHETATPGEYVVRSNLLVTRSRLNRQPHDFIAGLRDDLLRVADGATLLASRRILIDEPELGAHWSNVLL